MRFPLYLTEGCAPSACIPNTPRIPLFGLVGGALYGLLVVRGGVRRSLALGAAVGLAAGLVGGIVVAASIPQHDAYFVTVYRVYALAYLSAALLAASALFVRTRAFGAPLTWPLVATWLVATAAAGVVGDRIVAAAATASALAGVALGSLWRGPLPRVDPRTRVTAAIVATALVAFAVRAAFGLQTLARTGPGMDFAVASDDGDSYFRLASVLADHGGWSEVLGTRAFPPGYSVFVGTIFALTGDSLAAVIVVQALLAAGAAVLVFRIGRRIGGAGVGLLGSALYALDQNLIQNGSTLTAEALLVPLTLVAVDAFARYREAGRARWLVAAALSLAAAFVTRNLVGIALLLAATTWILWWRRGRPAIALRDIGIVAAAAILASIPVAAASYAAEGAPRLTTQVAGLAWDFDGGPGVTISNTFLVDRGIRPFEDPLGSVRAALSDPLPVAAFYATAVPQRLSTLLFFLSPGSSDPLLIANPLLYRNPFGDTVTLLRVTALIVGAVAIVRARVWRRAPELGLIAGYVLLYLAVFALVFPPYHPFRYRIPIEPFRFLVEAGGLLLTIGALLRAVAIRPAVRAPERVAG